VYQVCRESSSSKQRDKQTPKKRGERVRKSREPWRRLLKGDIVTTYPHNLESFQSQNVFPPHTIISLFVQVIKTQSTLFPLLSADRPGRPDERGRDSSSAICCKQSKQKKHPEMRSLLCQIQKYRGRSTFSVSGIAGCNTRHNSKPVSAGN
jgi:hypothetical protein